MSLTLREASKDTLQAENKTALLQLTAGCQNAWGHFAVTQVVESLTGKPLALAGWRLGYRGGHPCSGRVAEKCSCRQRNCLSPGRC